MTYRGRLKHLEKRTEYIVVAAALLAGWSLYSLAGPSGCMIKAVTGLPCPGCGLTRAYVALFHGHFRDAFFYHPLFPVVLLIGACVAGKQLPLLSSLVSNERWWGMIFAAFSGVYIIRMVVYFPHTPPMDFHTQAIVPRMIAFLLTHIGVIR